MLPFTSTYAMVPDTQVAPGEMANRTMVVIDGLNSIATEVAVCHEYYMYQGDNANTVRFAEHGEFMVGLAKNFFVEMGLDLDDDPSGIYYKNVEFSKAGMSNLNDESLSKLSAECARLDKHIEDTKNL